MLQRPVDLPACTFQIPSHGFELGRAKQPQRDMGLIGLLAWICEGGWMLSPATVGILRAGEPIGCPSHGLAIFLVEPHAGCKSDENLTGVERDGYTRRLMHHSALKAPVRKLDGNQ